MRVIIDTNVVISGIFFGSPPAKVLEAALYEQYQVILSEEIINDATNVQTPPCVDLDDIKFLQAAIASDIT